MRLAQVRVKVGRFTRPRRSLPIINSPRLRRLRSIRSRIRSLLPSQRRRRFPSVGRQSLSRRFPVRPQPPKRQRKGRTRVTTRKSGSEVNIDEIIP